jgi:hypothetical protein
MRTLLAAAAAALISLPAPEAGVLRGKVEFAAGGATSATVTLHLAYPPTARQLIDGFAQRSAQRPAASAQAGADGRFEVQIARPGRYYVRAEARGLAPAECGPFDLDPAGALPEVALALGPGATIAGKVSPAMPDGQVAGLRVVASRGDGELRSATTDAQGAYRLERLTPGRWHVRVQKAPAAGADASVENVVWAGGEIPWNVEAPAGAVTGLDIDLARRPALAGRLKLRHQPAAHWKATLRSRSGSPSIDACEADAQGAFRLECEAPGGATLALAGVCEGTELRLERDLDLAAGESAWERDVELGALVGVRADRMVTQLLLRGECKDGLRAALSVTPDAAGAFSVRALPAGAWRLLHVTFAGEKELGRVAVEAGREARVELK